MEERKLISFGNSSYVISVPKTWVNENNLNKGDKVYIDEKKDTITISAGDKEKEETQKVMHVSIDKKDMRLIQTEITSAYLNTYDIIEISGKQLKSKAPKVKSIVRDLTGLEIIQQSSTKIVAKDLLNIKEISVEVLIRRIDNIIRSMIYDSIKSVHKDYYTSIFHRDRDVNRLVFLSLRVLRAALENAKIARNLNFNSTEIVHIWIITRNLEKIADQTKRIARVFKNSEIEERIKTSLESMYKQLNEDYLEVMKAYHTRKLSLAYNVEITGSLRIENFYRFIEKNPTLEVYKICNEYKNMVNSIKNIARSIIGFVGAKEDTAKNDKTIRIMA